MIFFLIKCFDFLDFYTQLSPDTPLLESVSSIIEMSSKSDKDKFNSFPYIKSEQMDTEDPVNKVITF